MAKLNLLEHARKKTTQKVNLFEKVQIPGYQDDDSQIVIENFSADNQISSDEKINQIYAEYSIKSPSSSFFSSSVKK